MVKNTMIIAVILQETVSSGTINLGADPSIFIFFMQSCLLYECPVSFVGSGAYCREVIYREIIYSPPRMKDDPDFEK